MDKLLDQAVNELLALPGASADGTDWQNDYALTSRQANLELLKYRHLIRLAVASAINFDFEADVAQARRSGASWHQIAEATGIARQSAHERWRNVAGDTEA